MIKLNFLDVSHSDQVVTVGTHDIDHEELRDILSRWLRNHYWVIRICPNKMMISTKKLENCILYCVIAFAQKDFSHKSDRGHFRRILTAPLSRITLYTIIYFNLKMIVIPVCFLRDYFNRYSQGHANVSS